jgi:PQQ-dependent catabolism-associated beta-propeller protein
MKWGLMAGILVLLCCSPDTSQRAHERPSRSPAASSPLPAQDRDFLERAAQGGNAEIRIGALVNDHARNAEVIAFGRMMVMDHSAANRSLAAIAASKHIALPTALGDNQASFDRLADLKLDPFDREFAKVMVEDHQTAAQLFRGEAEAGNDPALKAFAVRTLPTILAHLERAKALAAAVESAPRPLASLYVTNERAGTIQVIDTARDQIVGIVRIGNRPRGIVVSPDRSRIYVAKSWWRDGNAPRRGSRGPEAIIALSTKTLTPLKEYIGGSDPECVAVAPDGKRLYESNEDASTATILDMATAKPLAALTVGTEPEGVTASPDGRWVYVTAETSNVITVIDARRKEVVANVLVDSRPRASVFTRDSKRAWVSAEVGGSVSLIDVQRHAVVRRIRLAPSDRPVGLVLSRDEKRLYVATGRGNRVVAIDTETMRAVAAIPTGNRVWGIARSRDGSKVYAANSLSNTVSVIDTKTDRVVRTIATDDGPWGLAVD